MLNNSPNPYFEQKEEASRLPMVLILFFGLLLYVAQIKGMDLEDSLCQIMMHSKLPIQLKIENCLDFSQWVKIICEIQKKTEVSRDWITYLAKNWIPTIINVKSLCYVFYTEEKIQILILKYHEISFSMDAIWRSRH